VSIGRFFDPRRGHSKKQMEMVLAFQRLVEHPEAVGWSFHLIGGCSPDDREYALAVKRAAVGSSVHVHLSAPGSIVTELLRRGSVYWHASGLGEDADRHPERFEHFGISVIEAMSAGLVPVVFGAAGPAEVVRDGVDGAWFRNPDELVETTRTLIRHDNRRAALAASAVTRAAAFGFDTFSDQLTELLETLTSPTADRMGRAL
jgi:glycosyltransferase involved in cell wall biosynthesis